MFKKKPEKQITFIVPTEKEFVIIDKNGEEITKNISYMLQYVNNIKLKHVELRTKYETVFLNTQILKMI